MFSLRPLPLFCILLTLIGCSPGYQSKKMGTVTQSSNDNSQRAKSLEAFRATTYNHVRTNCASCHSNLQNPKFAANAVSEAFDAIQTKINWEDLAQSKIVSQANNGHCQLPVCQNQGQAMLDSLRAWKAMWEGQRTEVEWTLTTTTFTEGDTTAAVSLRSSVPSTQELVIQLAVSGTALNPRDHGLPSVTTITIPAGQSQATLDLNLAPNTVDEGPRNLNLQIVKTADYNPGINDTLVVTINDDDPTPTLQFAAASQTVVEGAATVQAQIVMSGPSSQDVTVPFTLSGTAASGDHNLVAGSARIPAGATSTNISWALVDDSLAEGLETLVLNLGTPVNAVIGATSQHTVSITDNEGPPAVQFALTNQSGDEGTNVVIALSTSAAAAATIAVPYTISGSAIGGSDHNLASGTVTFLAGSTAQNIMVTLASDSLVEGDETLVVTLNGPTGATLGAATTHTLTIKDKTPPPTLQFASTAQRVSETTGAVAVAISLSTPSNLAISVPVTISGSATAGADFTLAATTLTISAGQTSANFTVQLLADQVFENDETVILTLGTPVNALLGTNRIHTVTITEGATAPVLEWSTANQTAAETTTSVTVTAKISTASASPISVPISVAGTASGAGADYNFSVTTLTIPAGATTQSINLTLVNDTVYEGNETVVLTLGTPNGANLGAVATHTLTITDNEAVPTLQLQAATASVSESAASTSFTLTLSGISARDTSVAYQVSGTALAPGDHSLVAGTVIVPALSSNKLVTFNLVNDNLYEGNETVIVTLTPGSVVGATIGGVAATTITLQDDDLAPMAQFSTGSQTVMESTSSAQLVVSLDKVSAQPVSIPLLVSGSAVANADYSVPNPTITIAPGSTQGFVAIPILNDTLYEGAEAVTFTLGTPTGGTLGAQRTHVLNIQDNDNMPQVEWTTAAQMVNENVGQVRIDAKLSAASGLPSVINYSVNGTAVAASDFNPPSGTLTIPAGVTTAAITLTVLEDSVPEPDDDTIVLTLTSTTGAALGATQTHTVTLTDNDSTGDTAIEGFRGSVYRFTRKNCVLCHGTTQVPLHASYTIPTAYAAAKSKVNFNAIPESTLVIKSKDGHCGLANCMTDGSAMIAAIEAWKPFEGSSNPPGPSGPVLTTADTQSRLGTRKFVSSKLVNLFGASDAQSIVDSKVLANPGIFGGACDLMAGTITELPFAGYLGNCKERPESLAPPIGVATSQRLALTIRACDQIAQKDNAVNTAAKTALSVTTSPAGTRFPDDNDVAALFRYFYRDRAIDPAVTTALRAVANEAQSKGYPAIDGWRFVLLTLCISPAWQIP